MATISHWGFRVLAAGAWPGRSPVGTIELQRDQWDDFGFGTTFRLFAVDGSDQVLEAGSVKIGRRGMIPAAEGEGTTFTPMPDRFDQLSADYFSVGQDSSYYESLKDSLGLTGATLILRSLRDLAINPSILGEVLGLSVVSDSLLRTVSTSTVKERFSRILRNESGQNRFSLTYNYETSPGIRAASVAFVVDRRDNPPSNIHALIGANGSGKTKALRDMRAFFSAQSDSLSPYLSLSDASNISGVVAVGFSAFDEPVAQSPGPSSLMYTVSDVGLGTVPTRDELKSLSSINQMGRVFSRQLQACLKDGSDRSRRLSRCLKFLETDLVLRDLRISDVDNLLSRLDFDRLSSGHKIVLLTVVNLVLLVDDKFLVLLDEPETHLHPPLLASFMRALSWLLADRNGLAVLATHSPVVLQELPRSCAWTMTRVGQRTRIDPLPIESFGENVGVLTQEVFKLQVAGAGFYNLLQLAAERYPTYELALESLGGSIGEEAQLLLRRMMIRRDS